MSHFLGAKLFLRYRLGENSITGQMVQFNWEYLWFYHAEQYDSGLLGNEMYNCNRVHQNKTQNANAAFSMRLEMWECYSKYSQSCSKDEKIPIIIETKNIIVCTPCRNRSVYCLSYILDFNLRHGCTVGEISYEPKGFRKQKSEEHWCKIGLPELSLPVHTFNYQFLLFIGSLTRIEKKKVIISWLCAYVWSCWAFFLEHFSLF